MRAVIFAGGSIFDYEYISSYIQSDDFIIAADSGLDHLKKLSIVPDVFIGDMDSVKSCVFAKEIIKLEVMKDETDTEAAIVLAKSKGADEILLFGATGTRLDHLLANVFLLRKIHKMKMKGMLIDEHNEIQYLKNRVELIGTPDDIVSVIPLSDLHGATTKGLFYELDNDTLEFGTSRGVSNFMTNNVCTITLTSGEALVIKSRD